MSNENNPAGCDLCSNTGPLHLRGRCHPTAPLRAEMDGAMLTLWCYVPECNRVVAKFAVADLPAPDREPLDLGIVAEDGLRRVEVMVAGAGRFGAYLIDRRFFSEPVWLRDVTTGEEVSRLVAALGFTK